MNGLVYGGIIVPYYYVTKNGGIFSTKGRELRRLKIHLDGGGYPFFSFRFLNKTIQTNVHRAVLETFVGPPMLIDGRRQVSRHLNGNKLDNRLENLRWGTYEENEADKKGHGKSNKGKAFLSIRGELNPSSKLTSKQVCEIRRLYKEDVGPIELGKRYEVHRATIHRIVTHKAWKEVL